MSLAEAQGNFGVGGEAGCFLFSSGSLPDYVPDVVDPAVNGQTQGLLSWSFWSHLGD